MGAAEKFKVDELLESFELHEPFCRIMLDAYALIDVRGHVIKFNPMLATILGQKSKMISRADSFEQLMELYVGTRRLSIEELMQIPAPTRFDEIVGKLPGGNQLNLIVSIFPFYHQEHGSLGAFFLMRDVTAEASLQSKYRDAQSRSVTDALTGLFTRSYFNDYLDLQTKRMIDLPIESEDRSLTLAMIDIDHFKKINDSYGHPAGDYIIRSVSELMRRCFRKSDVLCRYGGEEFLAILPATNIDGAKAASEKLRTNIENEKFEFQGKIIPVTASFGIAQHQVARETAKETLARADEALYRSKQNGRNRVTI